MKKINKKVIYFFVVIVIIGIIALINFYPNSVSSNSETVAVKKVGNQILADGTVDSQDTATLHFQVGGKLAYLPVKEGDKVYTGQTIAQLDTYTLQRQLTIALNNYRSTRNTFDQTNDNAKDNLAQGQQKYSIEKTTLSGLSGDTEYNAINDIVKRIVDQNQANLDNSVANVELANYTLQLASLASPIDGVITHLDVSTNNVNVTPTTSFTVADPDNLVFNANVSESTINYISVGNDVKIKVTNGGQSTGKVSKIYPQRFLLSNGESAYKVEITAPDLNKNSKMGQSGSVQIASNLSNESIVVPSWTVLGKKYIWVLNNDKPVLKTVKVGKIMGDETEILEGLIFNDKVILNPKSIATRNYKIL
jgi:HlyD family secretion protein